MALNTTGPISLAGATAGQSIALELGVSTTAQISLNDTNVRTLAGVASGAIVMPTNFYGKSSVVTATYTFTTSTVNASLNIATLAGYVAGGTQVTVTVNAGVYLWSNSTATPGLTLTGGTTGDTLTLVNNGYIIGQGGNGTYRSAGAAGGPALSLGYNTTINNTNASAYICGGGGAGAGGSLPEPDRISGGGGSGGGNGGPSWQTTGTRGRGGCAGVGGAIGSLGTCGTGTTWPSGRGRYYTSGSGGGGRVLPTGAGGSGGNWAITNCCYGWYGGAGGTNNSAGSKPTWCCVTGCGAGICSQPYGAGGGGGWGAAGGNSSVNFYLGGAGGKAVALNGKTVTWVSGDTSRVWGAVS